MTETLITVDQKTRRSFRSFLRRRLGEHIPDREVVATKTIRDEGVKPAYATDASLFHITLQGFYPINVYVSHDPEHHNGDVEIEARLDAPYRYFDIRHVFIKDEEKVTFPFDDVAETRITVNHNPDNVKVNMENPRFYNFSRIKFVENLRCRHK